MNINTLAMNISPNPQANWALI